MKSNTYEECLMELAAHIKFDPKDQDCIAQDDSQGYQIPPFDDTITFDNCTEQEVIKLLGRKKTWNLTLLKPFVDFYKHKAQRKHISLLVISSNSTFFKMVYKNHQNVSNLLGLAQKLQLVKCVDSTWRYTTHKAKVYAWNKQVEHILLSLFKSYNININSYSSSINQTQYNNIDENIREEDVVEASRRFNVKITSKTRLPISNELAAKMILDKYPQIKQLWQTLDEDNKSLEADEWTFAPLTIERSGSLKDSRISRIAIRARNSYCSAKVHDITEQDLISGRVLRDEVIKAKYGHVYEQDVKSSIYRVTYLLNRGVWLDDSIDLYEMIAGFKFETPEQRDLFKRPFCQKMYFSASSKDMKTKVCWNHQTTTRKYLEDNFGEATLLKARENMEKAIGFSYRSEIFLHESCIYAQVAHKLRAMGYKVFQVYDGFFTDKPLDRTTFNNIVKSEALSYYFKFINHHNHNHHQYQSSSINQSSYNNIDRNIRDNSDIPDEDSLIDIDKRRQEALQNMIDEQVISRRDASWLYFKLYDEEHAFKESRRGWCIEDRLKAKPARTYIMNTLVNRYPSKFTRKDVMNFIGVWL